MTNWRRKILLSVIWLFFLATQFASAESRLRSVEVVPTSFSAEEEVNDLLANESSQFVFDLSRAVEGLREKNAKWLNLYPLQSNFLVRYNKYFVNAWEEDISPANNQFFEVVSAGATTYEGPYNRGAFLVDPAGLLLYGELSTKAEQLHKKQCSEASNLSFVFTLSGEVAGQTVFHLLPFLKVSSSDWTPKEIEENPRPLWLEPGLLANATTLHYSLTFDEEFRLLRSEFALMSKTGDVLVSLDIIYRYSDYWLGSGMDTTFRRLPEVPTLAYTTWSALGPSPPTYKTESHVFKFSFINGLWFATAITKSVRRADGYSLVTAYIPSNEVAISEFKG